MVMAIFLSILRTSCTCCTWPKFHSLPWKQQMTKKQSFSSYLLQRMIQSKAPEQLLNGPCGITYMVSYIDPAYDWVWCQGSSYLFLSHTHKTHMWLPEAFIYIIYRHLDLLYILPHFVSFFVSYLPSFAFSDFIAQIWAPPLTVRAVWMWLCTARRSAGWRESLKTSREWYWDRSRYCMVYQTQKTSSSCLFFYFM